jgi:PAS domain S-box-containing protein
MHLAYRSYSAARADQARLVAVHKAAASLAAPLEPLDAVEEFLGQVADCFDAAAAELAISTNGSRTVHRMDRAADRYSIRTEPNDSVSLEGAVAALPGAVRLAAAGKDALSRTLAATGATDCLAAPLLAADRLLGAIVVFDLGGFQGSRSGQIAVFDALARETGGALAKGRLLADVLEQRRKLAEIVDSASDGILTLSADGVVLSWNPALERITGIAAPEIIGRSDLATVAHLLSAAGEPVVLSDHPLPAELFLTAADGSVRHLACSYSDGDMQATTVVVARDITAVDEHEALREEVTRLEEADAARRLVVEQLQHAVVPPPISVPGVSVAATYEPSDPSAPTGGDLWDWQVLPSGEVHLAVVDVLGHGVSATKDALAVIHTLRVVTAAGTPLKHVVAQADELLRAQYQQLVATVIVARYDPHSGRLLVASGGHPPALVITPRRDVRQIAASGGVIGWPGAGSDDVAETVLHPGDTLVLYTDGLVEARKNILDGIEALERHAAEVAILSAEDLADQLVERALAGAQRRDDTLALVLRREVVTAREQRASWVIAPKASAASELRRTLESWLGEHGLVAEDCLVVAAELLSNAVRAARTRVALHVRLAGDSVVLDVTDDGAADPNLAQRGSTPARIDAERGRGLYLVRSLSSKVDVLVTEEMTLFRATVPTAHMAPVETDHRISELGL